MKLIKAAWLARWPIFCLLLAGGLALIGYGVINPERGLVFALLGLAVVVASVIFIAAAVLGFRALAAWRAMDEKAKHRNSQLWRELRSELWAVTENRSPQGAKAPASLASRPKAPSSVRPSASAKISEPGEDIRTAKELLKRAVSTLSPERQSEVVVAVEPFQRAAALSASPVISVIIPMYNERLFVRETIESLQQQTFEDFEAIIIDDAGIDGSMSIAMEVCKDDTRFRLVRHSANAGLSAARNTGLRLARAPLVTFLDSDDMLYPDALEVRLKKIQSVLATGDANKIRLLAGSFCKAVTVPHSDTYETAIARKRTRAVDFDDVNFVNSGGECPFNPLMPLMFTDIARLVGGFDETFQHGCEDWDFWQRVMRNGYYFASTNRVAAIYRHKRGSMVKAMPREHFAKGTELFKRARDEIRPEHIYPGAPFVFERGVHYYEDQKKFARRTAQYAAICAFINKDAFEEVADSFAPGLASYVDLHGEIRPSIEQGVRRTIAVNEHDYKLVNDLVAPIVDRIFAEIENRVRLPRDAAAGAPPAFDVLIYTQNLSQARSLASVLAGLKDFGLSARFISLQTETGDQGDRAYFIENEFDYSTFNEAVLRRFEARAHVVMRPYVSTLRDALPSAGQVIEISSEWEVSLPDENRPLEGLPSATLDDAAAVIAEAVNENSPAPLTETWRDEAPDRPVPSPIVMAKEELFNAPPDYKRILELKDRWRGERCVIIGNGPSINETDLSLLKDEYTFAVNGIFYKRDQMGFDPTFYVVEDDAVMRENQEAISAYEAGYKLFPTEYKNLHPEGDNVFFFLKNRGFYEKTSPSYCVPRFSVDAARRLFCGQSVTHINLQLAYYFGFEEVYLIGVDFSYVIPDSAIRRGDLILSTEDDPNHFHGDYFGKGKTWKDPKLHRVKLNYELARDMFAADGRKVLNATKGGKLEVFERADYDAVFGRPALQASASNSAR